MSNETSTVETEVAADQGTKKDRVLAYFATNPEASAQDIQKHFEDKYGETVSTNYISMCKSGSGTARTRAVNVSTAISQLIKVRDLVAELGGADAVREAMEVSSKFTECVGSGNELEALDQLEQLS